MTRYDKNYYQGAGNEYRRYFWHQLAALVRALYIKLLFNPKTVLDLGCGMGNLLEMLRQLGVEAYGVEISEYALSQVPKRLKKFCRQGDILKMPCQDGKFDVVTTVNVLEHINPGDVDKFIAKCARIAQKGVYHEITVLEDKGTVNRDPTHYSKYSARQWLGKFLRLKKWRVKRGPVIPGFKNGIFILSIRKWN